MEVAETAINAETKCPSELFMRLREALPFCHPGVVAIIDSFAQANHWDEKRKAHGAEIGADGLTVTVHHAESVFSEQGYSSGRHYWELDVLSVGGLAHAGVAEAGALTNSYLNFAGYAVRGDSAPQDLNDYPYAKGQWLMEMPMVPYFKPGHRIGFLLDLGAEGDSAAERTLEYFLNGKSHGVTHKLPSGPFFPAVGGYGIAQFRARFDLPCPGGPA